MEEEVKYTSEFDGQTTDEVLKHAKSVKDLTIPSLSNISGFICIDNEGKAIGMMSKEQVAQVVGELIGQATSSQSGLMPAFRTMNVQYISSGELVVKYTLPASVGFSMCITAIKNHESNGQAVVFLTGYSGGIVADSIRKGSYLKGISYVSNSDSIDIYVQVSVYVFVTAVCLGSSHGKFITSASLVDSIPEGAKEVQL